MPLELSHSFYGTKMFLKKVLNLEVTNNPAGIYLLKFNNKSTRTMCEIVAFIDSGVFIVDFEQANAGGQSSYLHWFSAKIPNDGEKTSKTAKKCQKLGSLCLEKSFEKRIQFSS